MDVEFEENSPCQNGIISKFYQRPNESYFQEPRNLEKLINTGRLVQKISTKTGRYRQNIKSNPTKGIKRYALISYDKRNLDRIFN